MKIKMMFALSMCLLVFSVIGCNVSTEDDSTPTISVTVENDLLQTNTLIPKNTDESTEKNEESETLGVTPETITETESATNVKRTPFQTPIPIPVPVLTAVQYQTLLLQVNNPDCVLPCYLGITPGITSFVQADEILTAFGDHFFQEYEYEWKSTELSIKYYFFQSQIGDDWVSHGIDVYIVNGQVLRMDIVINSLASEYVVEGWGRYSIINVLNTVGVPDRIFVIDDKRDTRSVLFNYDEMGIAVDYGGKGPNRSNDVCPAFQEGITFGLNISLYAPESIPLLADFYDQPQYFFLPKNADNPGYWTSTPTSLGISSEEFTETLLADPGACFSRAGSDQD